MKDNLWWRSWGRLGTLDLHTRDAILDFVKSHEEVDGFAMESLYKNRDEFGYMRLCFRFDCILADALDVMLGEVEYERPQVPYEEELPF